MLSSLEMLGEVCTCGLFFTITDKEKSIIGCDECCFYWDADKSLYRIWNKKINKYDLRKLPVEIKEKRKRKVVRKYEHF